MNRAIIFTLALVLSSCNSKVLHKSKNYEITRDSVYSSTETMNISTDSVFSASIASSDAVQVEYILSTPEQIEVMGQKVNVSQINIARSKSERNDVSVSVESGSISEKSVGCTVNEAEKKSTTKATEQKKPNYVLFIFAIVFIVAVCIISIRLLRSHPP